MIRVVCDSTSDLSQELLEKYNIKLIPLHIVLDGKEYRDGTEITPSEIYKWSDETNQTPKTSASSIEDAIKVMEEIIKEGDEIIAFTISKSMSTTFNVFNLAAQYLDAQDKITVVDSKNLSSGIGLLALKTCDLIAQGKTRDEIFEELKEIRTKINSSFIVSTLTYLARGGRCSSASAMAGSLLGIKPVIELTDGTMGVTSKIRANGMDKMIDKYLELKKDQMLNADPKRVIIVESGIEKEYLDKIINSIVGLNHFEEIIVQKAGGVISSHCGPGTFGVMFENN